MPESRRQDMGDGGYCIYPKCDHKIPHERGIPCQDERCPECGGAMLRGSYHYRLLQQKPHKRGDQ